MKLDFNYIFTDENITRKVFTWFSRIGAAPKFGSRPIGWYQSHMCHTIDVLRERVGGGERELRCKGGVVEVRESDGARHHWHVVTPVFDLYNEADKRCRR